MKNVGFHLDREGPNGPDSEDWSRDLNRRCLARPWPTSQSQAQTTMDRPMKDFYDTRGGGFSRQSFYCLSRIKGEVYLYFLSNWKHTHCKKRKPRVLFRSTLFTHPFPLSIFRRPYFSFWRLESKILKTMNRVLWYAFLRWIITFTRLLDTDLWI